MGAGRRGRWSRTCRWKRAKNWVTRWSPSECFRCLKKGGKEVGRADNDEKLSQTNVLGLTLKKATGNQHHPNSPILMPCIPTSPSLIPWLSFPHPPLPSSVVSAL